MRLVAIVGGTSAVLLLIFLAMIEFRHELRFGHFVRPGLHADYVVSHADLGIPGITKVYAATLTNFGIIPRKVWACQFVTDDMERGTEIAFAIQKWDRTGQAWSTVMQSSEASFCKPYPLGIIEGKVAERQLWPGQGLSIWEEATGARFQKGDVARFVLFTAEPWTITSGYPTSGFEIDEQIETAAPLRVTH